MPRGRTIFWTALIVIVTMAVVNRIPQLKQFTG